MGTSFHKNCYRSQNFSIVKAPKPIRFDLIKNHYSNDISIIDDKSGKIRNQRHSNFKLAANIQNSNIITRRRRSSHKKNLFIEH